MIKFFRHIRQNLIIENKTTNYVKYAIGEIVLVVIGILIALQINNWNETQKDKKQEHLILKNLNFEFKKNKMDIETFKKGYISLFSSTNIILNLIGENNDVLESHNLDSLISESINYYDYRPTQYVLSDLISSGNLKLITSDSLRLQLFEWASFINEKEESWQTLDDFSQNMLIPYLTKNGSLKNIDSYGILKWEKKSKLKANTINMFHDIEFENNLDNHAWGIANYISTLDNLEKTIDKIISLTSNN